MNIYKAMGGLFVLAIPLFVLGGVFADSDGVEGVIGGIGWFGFLACAAALVVLAVVALVQRRRPARA
jgi:hypothetical protein